MQIVTYYNERDMKVGWEIKSTIMSIPHYFLEKFRIRAVLEISSFSVTHTVHYLYKIIISLKN